MSSLNDFDDDFDDILNSDDEIPKKSIPTIENTIKLDEIPSKPHGEKYTNDLMIDPLDSLTTKPKLTQFKAPNSSIKTTSSKPAKSVLEDLLAPASKFDDMSMFKSSSKDPIASRPSTSEPLNSKYDSQSNKRTVRFSTENLDEELESPDYGLNRSTDVLSRTVPVTSNFNDFEVGTRPKTAPISNKPAKFVSRFEEAEFEELNPSLNQKSFEGSDSHFSYSKNPDSGYKEETRFQSDSFDQIGKIKDSPNEKSKTNAKKKLDDFIQSSQKDLLLATAPSQIPTNQNRSYVDNLLENIRPKTAGNKLRISEPSNNLDIDIISHDKPTRYKSNNDEETKFIESSSFQVPTNDIRNKKWECEKEDLSYKLKMVEKKYQQDKEMTEKHYKNRIEMLEENSSNKIKRMQEEIDMLVNQNKMKMQMLDDERQEMRKELNRRQEDADQRHNNEVARIQEQHRYEVNKLKEDHQEMLQRIQMAHQREDDIMRNAQPTSIQLQNVLSQVSSGAEGLLEIRKQLEEKWSGQVREQSEELRRKDEHLDKLQQRIERERDENTAERERLQNLISKLDIQLRDQTKLLEDEKWSIKQQEQKLIVQQSTLEKERDQHYKDRESLQVQLEEARAKMLLEQKAQWELIYEEKRQLSEERIKLSKDLSKWAETNHISMGKKTQEMAEAEGLKSALVDEQFKLDREKQELAKEKQNLMTLKSQLELTKHNQQMKADRLAQLEKELETRQSLLNNKEAYFLEIESKSNEAFSRAQQLHSQHQAQLTEISTQLAALADKEKLITKDILNLEREKKDLKNKEGQIICKKCSNSLRDSAIGNSIGLLKTQSYGSSINKLPPPSSSYHKRGVHQGTTSDWTGDNSIQYAIEYSQILANQMEEERLMNSLRMQADQDREYLSQEKAYLDSLSNQSRYSLRS